MRQTLKTLFTTILVTLVAACGVATPAPENTQTATPIFTEAPTSSATPATPSATPPARTLMPIPTNTAHPVSLDVIGARGDPRFSPDGARLLLPTSLGIMVVDTSSYQNWHLQIPFDPDSYDRVTISPDGELIIRGNQLMALDDAQVPPALQIPASIRGEGFRAALTESRFTRDNRLLAALYADARLDLWDLRGEKFLFSLPGVLSMDFSPDGRRIVAVSVEDYTWHIRLYETQAGTLLKEWSGQSAVFLPDNRLALESAGTIRIYDLSTDKVSHFFNGRFPAISPDGKWIAMLHYDRVDIYQIEDGKLLQRLPSDFADVDRFDLRFSPDGESLAGYSYWAFCCAGYAGRLSLWRVEDGSVLREVPFTGTFDFSTDGRSLAVAYNGLEIWDTTDGSVRVDLTEITLR